MRYIYIALIPAVLYSCGLGGDGGTTDDREPSRVQIEIEGTLWTGDNPVDLETQPNLMPGEPGSVTATALAWAVNEGVTFFIEFVEAQVENGHTITMQYTEIDEQIVDASIQIVHRHPQGWVSLNSEAGTMNYVIIERETLGGLPGTLTFQVKKIKGFIEGNTFYEDPETQQLVKHEIDGQFTFISN